MTNSLFQLVMTNLPDAQSASNLAQTLVAEGLASCVNILPPMQSIYTWKGKIESVSEHLVLIKSQSSRYASIQERILALHPYELPEIIAVPIADGLPAFLNWLNNPEINA